MTIFKTEIRQGRNALIIWTGAIAFMLLMCIVIYPQMKSQMDEMSQMMANMGSFSAAFGMDQLSFGTLIGYYGIECGNILGIGGAFYAAYLGISVLSKEESGRTAEFLLTHPVSRTRVVLEKLLAVLTQILFMNAAVVAISLLGTLSTGETLDIKGFLLLHLANLLLQVELACICIGISAFLRRSGIGIGLGIAAMLYFANIIGNLTDKAEFVKYITPFKYAQSSDVLTNNSIDVILLLAGAAYTAAGIICAFIKYGKKDIAA